MKDLECIGCSKGQKKKGIIYCQIIISIQQKGQQSLCPITMGLATDPQQTNSIQFHIRTLNSWFVLVYAPLNDMTGHLNRKVVAYV